MHHRSILRRYRTAGPAASCSACTRHCRGCARRSCDDGEVGSAAVSSRFIDGAGRRCFDTKLPAPTPTCAPHERFCILMPRKFGTWRGSHVYPTWCMGWNLLRLRYGSLPPVPERSMRFTTWRAVTRSTKPRRCSAACGTCAERLSTSKCNCAIMRRSAGC